MAALTRRRFLGAALLAQAALATVDIITGREFLVRSLYLVPVLALAVRAGTRQVAASAVVAVALVLLSPLWNGVYGQEWLVPTAVVSCGSALAVWAARARERAEADRRQLQLLGAAAQITDGDADIEDALARLVRVLVPGLGDAAWIDVLDRDGRLRRLATRARGNDAAAIEAWLFERPHKVRGTLSPSDRVLAGHGPQIAVLDEAGVEAIVGDAEDRAMLARSELRMTMAVPLALHGQILGVLSVGVGPSGRRFTAEDGTFAELLAGRAALALGNAQLVGRLSAAQRRLDGILGALAEAVTVHDAQSRVVYANQAAVTLLGARDADEVTSADPGAWSARFAITDADGRPIPPDRLPGRRVILGEQPEPLLTRSVIRATGEVRWFLTKATPLHDEAGEILAVNVIEDVTEETEARLREVFLTEAGKALASSLDYGETLQRVARLAVPRLADWCAVEMPDERGVLEQVALAHVDPDQVAAAQDLRERYPPDPDSPAGSYAVLRSGTPQLIPEVTDAMLVAGTQDEEHLERIRALRLNSAISVPMLSGGRTLGVMTFVYTGDRRYDQDDVPFAQELAARAATAVENARLYTERADVAHTLQASLLPDTLPELPGWRAAADYRPGQAGAEVGGDFYDLFAVPGGAMVILGDVTGKGVTAAALTSLVRHTARTAAHFDPRPSAVLELVNGALRRQPRIAPVTMVCGLLRDREVILAAGGHPLPLLKRTGEAVRKVGEPGLLLGAVDTYAGTRDVLVELAPGDTLLLFTDGVTDTPGVDGRFGDAGLREAVEQAPATPEELLERLRATLDAFQEGTVLDDRAILALQYTGGPAAPPDEADYRGAAVPSSSSAVPVMTVFADTPFS